LGEKGDWGERKGILITCHKRGTFSLKEQQQQLIIRKRKEEDLEKKKRGGFGFHKGKKTSAFFKGGGRIQFWISGGVRLGGIISLGGDIS